MRAIVPRDVGYYSYAATGYANPHAATSVGGATLTYDNNGNVTAIGSLNYTWDWRNRLASAERTGGGITTYGYDHTGQRMFKATGTATTSYPNKYYNLATTTGSATTTKHIFSPGGELLATVVGASTTASTTYLHADHLGGTNAVTDEDGEITQTLDYYPYGSQRIAAGSFSEQRRFIGEEYDGDTEFSYLNARYYQGSRGHFLSQDPLFVTGSGDITDPQRLNSYAYGRNTPIALFDTSGLDSAYFAARPVLFSAQHIYEAYSIDTQSVANQLNIGISIPSNVSADNPFNFTLGFFPSSDSALGTGSNIIMGIGSEGGRGSGSSDYLHAMLRDRQN